MRKLSHQNNLKRFIGTGKKLELLLWLFFRKRKMVRFFQAICVVNPIYIGIVSIM